VEGKVSDFHLLLEEQLPKLMRYATALTRDPDEAGQLVEDMVHEALANQDRCPHDGSVRVWLLTILHDLRDNPFRRADEAPPPRGPEAEFTLSDLDRAMGHLLEEQRAVILLIGLEAMTYEQTASVLRIPVGTMRSRLARGRDGLRRALGLTTPATRETRAA
jgi:RNA polymerase sigma-70 factor, ECF subfamily